MASLAKSENYLAVCARAKVIVTTLRGVICLKHDLANDDNLQEHNAKEVDDLKNKIPRKEENHIIDCRFSPFEKYFAICSSDKILLVWEVATWNLAYTRNIPRRPMKLIFSQKEDVILIADKTGNVYRFDLPGESLEHLLGHLSVILDMLFSSGDKELVTCDRDGKIRISCYPNCYNIEKFLMAHSSFVPSMTIDHSGQYLMSIDGEKQLFLWDIASGHYIDNIKIEIEGECIPRRVCMDRLHGIYVLVDGSKKVLRYQIKEEKLQELKEIPLENNPLDLLCDDQNIILLQQSAGQPLIFYHINEEKECVKLGKDNQLSSLNEIQQFLPDPMKLEPWKCSGWADDDT